MLSVKKFNIPVFRYIIYPHLCKITALLLLNILKYCVKTQGTPFSFSPRNGIFTHLPLVVDNLLFRDDQYISFLPSFPQ